VYIFRGTIANQKYCAISKSINDINMETKKTTGMVRRCINTPFINRGFRFSSTSLYLLVAYRQIMTSNKLVVITTVE
jgi:hypothetical protein